MTIAFDDNIPRRGPEIFIKRLKGGEAKTFVLYGTKIRGIWVHWNGGTGKSEPHYEENCSACSKQIGKRWKGFLHAFCVEEKQQVFLELTPSGAAALLHQLADPETIRGNLVRVKRSPAQNGRLQIVALERVKQHDNLPPEKDPRRSILKLWGVSQEETDRLFGRDQAGEVFSDDEEGECL